MAGSYQWLTLTQAIKDLAQRLSDPAMDFWTAAELTIYIQQALRIYNSLTWMWRADFTFSTTGNPTVWTSLGSLTDSPRLRTITDTYCYTELEYMLLEPPSGNTWTGTNQFSISDLSDALLRRRNQIIKATNCNQMLLQNIALVPNTTRTFLPDNILDVERVRYIPVAIPPATPPSPTTLYRDDTVAQEFYEAPLYQQNPGTPNTFSLSSEPPLSWDVDIPPNLPGSYEAVVLQAGVPFDPSVGSTLLNLPDDFAWVAEWGALADILGQESESTDRERSEYALKRYNDGVQLMMKTPWIELGKVNQQAVSVDSIVDTDRYSPEWDSNSAGFGPVIVAGGIDFIASPTNSGVGVTVLGNAPVPSLPGDFVQVAKGSWDTVLDIAQVRAVWKCGGAEFKAVLEIDERAIKQCSQENERLRSLGAFSDILVQRGTSQERAMNRFNSKQK